MILADFVMLYKVLGYIDKTSIPFKLNFYRDKQEAYKCCDNCQGDAALYYIRLNINGMIKYLYNYRMAVFLPGYARKFPSAQAAQRYMKGKQVGREHPWWIVKAG